MATTLYRFEMKLRISVEASNYKDARNEARKLRQRINETLPTGVAEFPRHKEVS